MVFALHKICACDAKQRPVKGCDVEPGVWSKVHSMGTDIYLASTQVTNQQKWELVQGPSVDYKFMNECVG